MKAVGVLTTAVTAAVAVYATVLLIRSLPDIRRYFKIRSM
ncbi:DUF6893 family small protein [Actinoplanes aureus]|jgi:hypothetical protein